MLLGLLGKKLEELGLAGQRPGAVHAGPNQVDRLLGLAVSLLVQVLPGSGPKKKKA